jgi:hypothetical protein
MKIAFKGIMLALHVLGILFGVYGYFQLADPINEKLTISLLIFLLLNFIRLIQQPQ